MVAICLISESRSLGVSESRSLGVSESRSLGVSESRSLGVSKQFDFRYSACQLINQLAFVALLLTSVLNLPLATAADNANCTATECNYSVPLDKPGFYTVAVTIPSGQKAGVYNLLIDPSVPYEQAPIVNLANGFHGGGLLKEGGQSSSWVGFSLAQFEPVNISVYNHSNPAAPLDLILTNSSRPEQTLLKFGPIFTTHGQIYTTPILEPGFYVASVNGYPNLPLTAYSISVGGSSVFGGINGGWLDSNNAGWGAFYATQPRTVNLKVQFGNTFGEMGIGLPNIKVYYHNQSGIGEIYWSSSKNEDSDFVEPTMPSPLPEPAVLPADPSEAGKTTLQGIDSDRDGIRDDVQRFIALTYQKSEDKPLRAALREYAAFLQQLIIFASSKNNSMLNAQTSGEIVDCIIYLHPNDGTDILLDIEAASINTDQRNLAYIEANAQLNGEMFSLTPSSELPQVCSRFTEQGGQRSSVRADTQPSEPKACSNEKFTYIVFGNGISNSPGDARGSLNVLKNAFEEGKTDEEKAKFAYELAYNYSGTITGDVYQVFKQSNANKNANFVKFLEGDPDTTLSPEEQQAIIDEATKIVNTYYKNDTDMRTHVGNYEEWIDSGNKVVVVGHSQGTLYTEFDYSKLKSDEANSKYPRLKSFGIVDVAKVSSPIIGPYTTLDIDKVVASFRFIKDRNIPESNTHNTS